MNPKRPIETELVFYERNVQMGLGAFCHEVISHKQNAGGYIRCEPTSYDGFNLLHRWVYQENSGPYDRNLCVLHRCDNPSCINPEHLFLGTQRENNEDMKAKGRLNVLPAQEAAVIAHRRLSDADVRVIKTTCENGPWGCRTRMAEKYGVSASTICNVLANRFYKDVSNDG